MTLDTKTGKIIALLCLIAIPFICNAQLQPRKQVYKLDSTTFIKRGVYDMHLSRNGSCVTYPAYYSNTNKIKTRFHRYYILNKTKKGWKLIPVN